MATRIALTTLLGGLGAAACTMTVNVADDRSTLVASGNAGMPANLAGAGAGVNAGHGGITILTTPPTGGANSIWFGSTRELGSSDIATLEQLACNTNSVVPESPATKIEIVLDASSSMENSAPGSDRSKWAVTRDMLVEILTGGDRPGLPANTAVGIVPFPNLDAVSAATKPLDVAACLNTKAAIPLAPLGGADATSHRSRLRQGLDEVTLGRGASTVDAFNWALNNQLLPAVQAVPGDAYMLLITDGMPTVDENCVNASGTSTAIRGDSVVSAVDSAYRAHVKTFAIGLPGSEEQVSVVGSSKRLSAKAWLSNAAFFGDTPIYGCNPNSDSGPFCHIDLSNEANFTAAIADALTHIVTTILECKFAVPTKSIDGNRDVDVTKIAPLIRFGDGTMRVLGQFATANADCSNGFRRINDNTQLELCADTCREYRNDPNASLRILVGCTVEDVNPPLSGI